MTRLKLTELYHFRELLLTWTMREIRIRYKQSLLGAAWAILQPFSLMVIFTVVFGYFVKVPTGDIPYPIFSYSALLPWTFFAAAITQATGSLVSNMNLVTKIYFPREILPLASIGAAFLDFLVGSVLFFFLMIVYRFSFYMTLVFLPVLLIIQVVLIAGICLLTSSIIVSYRDLRFVVPLALQLWMYLTPIVYPIELVPERLRTLYMLNPMATLIDSYRRITLLGVPPQWDYLVITTIISAMVLLLGYGYFRRTESTFADII